LAGSTKADAPEARSLAQRESGIARPYRVERVRPEWALEHEEMGSKTKFWYRRPEGRFLWLFKYPHPDTGEHWAEKVAAEVAQVLGTPHAVTKLAVCDGERGSISKSFVRAREQLFHGNQEMAGALDWCDPARRFHQSEHTLVNIFRTLDNNFLEPEDAQSAKSRIAEYMVLDALIGNTDRHHENWGVLLLQGRGVLLREIAPSFDHASSLGRELRDRGEGRTRERILTEHRISAYSERARGAVFWSADEPHAPSPLELVRRARHEFPDDFLGALRRLQDVRASQLSTCVERVPSSWISHLAREFAIELMSYNLCEMRKLLR
jgi:HipA-like C-terminal domain